MVLDQDEDQILGYIVMLGRDMAWVYVKSPYRDSKHKQDPPQVARKLLESQSLYGPDQFKVLIRTPAWQRYSQKHHLEFTYNHKEFLALIELAADLARESDQG
jgi:hypothetical protein